MIPGTESPGSCSFFIYLRPAKKVENNAAREAFPGSHELCDRDEGYPVWVVSP